MSSCPLPHQVRTVLHFVHINANLIPAIANIGWRFYIIFAVLNLAWTPFIWYFYVETAGLSLEEVDLMFSIKYNGGKGMTYKTARRLALEQRQTSTLTMGEKEIQASQVEFKA